MTSTDIAPDVTGDLAAKANRHLWGHFARHGEHITRESRDVREVVSED
jgi:hypothetical protein